MPLLSLPHGVRRRRGAASVTTVVSVLAAISLAACSGPGSSSSTSAAAVTPTAVSTAVGSTPTTLTLFTGAGTKAFSQGLADAFHAKYPAITITLQVEADNNYNTVLPRLLASNSPPDIAAPSDLLQGVKDNLLTNLDPYSQAYGWSQKVPSTILAAGEVNNGVIGSGPLYEAGGAAGPLVGVFYNKSLAAKVGMTQVPATLADLEAVMAKAKSMGITPIVASNGDGLIGHLYDLLLAEYMGPQQLLDVVWHKPGATLDTAGARQATATLADWMKKGYFNSDANAINQDASYGEFASGKGLFMVQGTWITQALPKAFAGHYGIFPLPPKTAGGTVVSMTGNSLAFSIPAHSTHKDAAALFLNFLTTPEAAKVAADNGYPSAVGASATTLSLTMPLTDQIQAGYSEVAAGNGFTQWLQNADTSMTPALTAQLQSLLAGKTTPDAMVSSLQSTYAAALGQ
ncbi:MAG: extracellular solute-binding protein [Propionibacterium sp.]|nr:extracellular solute-binding protein [Propionibacterium sp.]